MLNKKKTSLVAPNGGRRKVKLDGRSDPDAPRTPKASKPSQQFFNEEWLAKRWGSSISLVRKMRYSGGGPQVTYFGSMVRYKLHDVRVFERKNRFKSSADKDAR